jgi:hypothetical protein
MTQSKTFIILPIFQQVNGVGINSEENLKAGSGLRVGEDVKNVRAYTHVTKGSFKNNVTFWTPMHLVQLSCEKTGYPDMPNFSALPAGCLTP